MITFSIYLFSPFPPPHSGAECGSLRFELALELKVEIEESFAWTGGFFFWYYCMYGHRYVLRYALTSSLSLSYIYVR